MRHGQRKSTPKVRDGKVQKKNRHALSPDIYRHDFEELQIIRERPVKGYYHPVSPSDVRRWIACIPDWEAEAAGLRAVVLTAVADWCYGRYNNAGIIKLDAWPKAQKHGIPARKNPVLEMLGLPPLPEDGDDIYLEPAQARAFLLLGTFLHELGHHVDRMTTRSRADAANGESFAIEYELRRQKDLWPAYVREFGMP